MRIICPCCQTDFPIEAGINDVEARKAIQRAFSITPIGGQLLGYVQLFKPEKQVLRMSKITQLLDELVGMMQEGKIKHGSRTYAAPIPYWESAIDQMLTNRDKLKLPIKTHNYLIAIIARYADQAEKKQEKKAEHKKATGNVGVKTPAAKPSKMPDDVKDQLNQFLNKTTNQGESNGQNSHEIENKR